MTQNPEDRLQLHLAMKEDIGEVSGLDWPKLLGHAHQEECSLTPFSGSVGSLDRQDWRLWFRQDGIKR
jgi:hypothetical protein